MASLSACESDLTLIEFGMQPDPALTARNQIAFVPVLLLYEWQFPAQVDNVFILVHPLVKNTELFDYIVLYLVDGRHFSVQSQLTGS